MAQQTILPSRRRRRRKFFPAHIGDCFSGGFFAPASSANRARDRPQRASLPAGLKKERKTNGRLGANMGAKASCAARNPALRALFAPANRLP